MIKLISSATLIKTPIAGELDWKTKRARKAPLKLNQVEAMMAL